MTLTHSDVLGGALIMNDEKLYDRLFFNIKTMGTSMSPFEAWVALRGSKTLKLRAEKCAENALAIAKMLEKHPKCVKVIYPGLKSHPHYAAA
jgi:cystathionine gamma-lyase